MILLFLLACAFVVWRSLLYWELRDRFAEMRKAGMPASGTEMNKWRGSVPDRENGAIVLADAFSLIRTVSDGRSNELRNAKFLDRTNEWSVATRAMVEEYVQLNAPALAKLQEALEFTRFQFPADFSYGPDTPLPHLAEFKKLAGIVASRSCLAAANGREQAWPDDVGNTLRLARTLDDEPIAISFLVRCTVIQTAVKTLERNLNRTSLDHEASLKLQRAFVGAARSNLLSRAFVGERAIMTPAFRLSKAEAESVGREDEDSGNSRPRHRFAGKPNPFLWVTGFFERDLNFFLQTMDHAISLAAQPPPRSLALTNSFEQAGLLARRRYYILSGLLLPSYSRIILRDVSTEASLRFAVTALGIEQFRLTHGRLPETLTELTPQFLTAVPDDPFNGQPFGYRRLARGYVLYSVGADGEDNGGRESIGRRKSTDQTPYDITFMVER